MYSNEESRKYSKIKNKEKHMEKDIHSSTDSENDDDKKYLKQKWAWNKDQLVLIQLDSDTIKREYRKLTC